MPIYEFQCGECDRVYEEHRPMAECSDLRRCADPACCGYGVRIFSAPQVRTSSTFLAKDPRLGGAQFSNETREYMLRMAAEAGVSVEGKAYDGRLAAFPGDPEAWVEGPDDYRRVCEKRGWSCEGDVTVKGREVEPVRTAPLADDVVESLVEDRLVEQFGEDFTEVSGPAVEHAREDVINTHSPPAHMVD